nr:MAG TPA: hypothetical protein [Caudoviricetes sp.]
MRKSLRLSFSTKIHNVLDPQNALTCFSSGCALKQQGEPQVP